MPPPPCSQQWPTGKRTDVSSANLLLCPLTKSLVASNYIALLAGVILAFLRSGRGTLNWLGYTCIYIYLPTYLLTYLYQPTYLPILQYLPTYLPTDTHSGEWSSRCRPYASASLTLYVHINSHVPMNQFLCSCSIFYRFMNLSMFFFFINLCHCWNTRQFFGHHYKVCYLILKHFTL